MLELSKTVFAQFVRSMTELMKLRSQVNISFAPTRTSLWAVSVSRLFSSNLGGSRFLPVGRWPACGAGRQNAARRPSVNRPRIRRGSAPDSQGAPVFCGRRGPEDQSRMRIRQHPLPGAPAVKCRRLRFLRLQAGRQ